MTNTTMHSAHTSAPLPDVFSSALTEIFNTVRPGIVQVYTEQRGGGTGVIWSVDGRIITNNHVVPDDHAQVQIRLADGRILPAQVLHRNPSLDLALLKTQADTLQALPLGNSAQLRIGEWVFAIGHPWEQRWAMTAGIVSSISSIKVTDTFTTHYIKSDVRLAPGNSGGPLLNADAEVVGINAMIFGGDLSVSIPSNVVSQWLSSLPKERIMLGIELQQVELPSHIRQSLQPDQQIGLLLVGIRPERQSLHQDLLIGDILLEVAGKQVHDVATLRHILNQGEEGKAVAVKLLRGGKLRKVTIATLVM